MSWYTTGTVSVTNGSTTVTGTGTQWVAGIRKGWALVLSAGQVYEIESVNSDTTLTLARAFEGSTQAGLAYSVMPTQGLEAGIRAALQDLITDYQGIYDTAGQGKFGDGSAALPGVRFTADEDTGVARLGANLLSLVAGGASRLEVGAAAITLNLPLKGVAAQTIGSLWCGVGGSANAIALTYGVAALTAGTAVRFMATAANTGATTIALDGTAARACRTVTGEALPAGYIRTDVATEAIYDGTYWVVHRAPQAGTNSNGRYLRLADGTQICQKTVTTAFLDAGTLRYTWGFPASFAEAPTIVTSINAGSYYANSGLPLNSVSFTGYGGATVTYSQIYIYAQSGNSFASGATSDVSVVAHGRWY